jgi:hypothetical protein
MTALSVPEYRLRLFLSVDLTGSTQFKATGNQSNFKWLKVFQKFYGDFPALFASKYRDVCDVRPNVCNVSEKIVEPKVWKTIGDEIIFVNRILSLAHLGAYMTAFSEALKEFGAEVQNLHGLNTKGNAWIAAFPNPNCSIQLSTTGDSAPISGQNDLVSEEFELQADENPKDFDFLGKGIDSGFRISRNSSISTFTISPALALLLCRAKSNVDMTEFDCDFLFQEVQRLKGVVGGKLYPIISIDTNRDDKEREIENLQAELLKQPTLADWKSLMTYLEKYIAYYKIEDPILKVAKNVADVAPPAHYQLYRTEWAELHEDLNQTNALETEAAEQGDGTEDGSLEDALSAADELNS